MSRHWVDILWHFLIKRHKIIIYIYYIYIYKPLIWILLQFNWLVATWYEIWMWGFLKQITNSFTCVYMCVYVPLYICACKCGYTLYVYMFLCVCMYIYVCMCICIYVYICAYVYIYMCVYIYIYYHYYYYYYYLTFKLLLCSTFARIFSVRFFLDDIYQF